MPEPVHNPASALYQDNTTNLPSAQKGTDGASWVANQAQEEGQALGHDYDHLAAAPINAHTYISSATTTVVSAGPCLLHTITLTETAAGTITVYDNTAGSGTVIAVLKASIAEQTFVFDVLCEVGLTIVTAGASKLTVAHAPVAAGT